jgi:hypothetical protein
MSKISKFYDVEFVNYVLYEKTKKLDLQRNWSSIFYDPRKSRIEKNVAINVQNLSTYTQVYTVYNSMRTKIKFNF